MSAQQQSIVEQPSPTVHSRAVRAEALALAVVRDLGRLEQVLDGPVTAVRRQALAWQLGFLLDRMADLHRLLDTAIWPAAAADDPELAGLAAEVRAAHAGLTWPVSELRAAARQWSRTPETRAEVLSALRETSPSGAAGARSGCRSADGCTRCSR